MKTNAPESLAHRTRHWLSSFAVPLWLERGFDRRRGYFHEGLNADLTPVAGPVRAMVQARQIYSFRVALDLDLCPMETAARAITDGARFLLDHCRNEDGSYAFQIEPGLGITRATPELYTQAFALFGLGNAYALSPLPEYKRRALDLLEYLRRHRAGRAGGFTEYDRDGRTIYRSNPVMHLFEAALYWMEIDAEDDRWETLGRELARLALDRLIDPVTGLLAEEFNAEWAPTLENGRFYWEPGHQFEWAWLLGRYQKVTGEDTSEAVETLYALATKHGVRDGRAIDQAWSDLTHRARSARFWPQAERAKAAILLGHMPAAEEALGALSSYLDVPAPGLWCDTLDESGRRDERPSKASSFYHIIGAMSEYLAHAPESRRAVSATAGDRGDV